MERQKLIDDLRTVLEQSPAPKIMAPSRGVTLYPMKEVLRLVENGALLPLSRRYVEAIIQELEFNSPERAREG